MRLVQPSSLAQVKSLKFAFSRATGTTWRFFRLIGGAFPSPLLHSLLRHGIWERDFGGSSGLPSIKTETPLCFEPLLPEEVPLTLDENDHTILSTLANFQYLNLQEVARALHMPSSSLQYRTEKLEASKVIRGHFYVLEPKAFGELP